MLDGLVDSHARAWIKAEELGHQIDCYWISVWVALLPDNLGWYLFIKVELCFIFHEIVSNVFIWHEFKVRFGQLADKLLNHLNLIEVVLTGEDWRASDKLSKDATYSPHVDFLVVVLLAQHDFRRSVPPCHDILGQSICKFSVTICKLFYSTSQSEITYFQVTVRIDKQIARFNVSMHYIS